MLTVALGRAAAFEHLAVMGCSAGFQTAAASCKAWSRESRNIPVLEKVQLCSWKGRCCGGQFLDDPSGKLPLLRASVLVGGGCARRTELSVFFASADPHPDSC